MLNYNDREQKRLADQRAERERQAASLTERRAAFTKSLNERAARNHEAAEAERERVEKEQQEAVQKAEAKAQAKAAWIAAGNAPIDFEIQWPRLRDEAVKKAMQAKIDEAFAPAPAPEAAPEAATSDNVARATRHLNALYPRRKGTK